MVMEIDARRLSVNTYARPPKRKIPITLHVNDFAMLRQMGTSSPLSVFPLSGGAGSAGHPTDNVTLRQNGNRDKGAGRFVVESVRM